MYVFTYIHSLITWACPVDLKFVEPVQKHINKSELRIILQLNSIILLPLRHKWHTTISVWARRNLTRGRWFKMAQKLTLKRNYNLRQSRQRRCDVGAFAVMAALQWFGLFPYTYILWLLLWKFWLLFKAVHLVFNSEGGLSL